MTVLILADDGDPSVDLVVEELRERERPTARFDIGAFPTGLDLDATLDAGRWTGRLRTPQRCVDLEAITGIWRRSPTAFRFPATLSGPERQHAATEAKLGLGGVLLALPVPWLDRPDLAATATYKPLQLSVAAAVGLSVPPTLVTNRADAVRTFCRPRRAVTKMLGSPGIHESSGRRIAYTERVTAPMLDQLDGIATTAHQFQQWVDKAFEVRVVVVGTNHFAVAIHAGSPESHIDWRADYPSLSYEVVTPPADVGNGIAALMARLGLRYGALDFAVDHDGRWWFLEVNPGGQYGWLEQQAGIGVTAAIADLLTEEAR